MKKLILILSILATIYNLSGQNIGINTIDPKETIHMQMDTQNVVLRFDNRKSDENGTVDTTIRCSPSSIAELGLVPSIPWSNPNVQDLQLSDDIYTRSGIIDFGDRTDNLLVSLGCDHPVPVDATINSATVSFELKAQSIGPNPAGRVIVSCVLKNDISTVDYIAAFADSLIIEKVYSNQVTNMLSVSAQDINNNELNASFIFQPASDDVELLIDHVEMAINYTFPATGLEEVRWTAGVQNGKFNISNSPSITNNQYLSISEVGLTRLKSLQITDNAADGKILTSGLDGSALWRFPTELGLGNSLIWSQAVDTAVYDQGPVKIQNSDELALCFNNGRSRLQNSDNLLLLENSKLNFLIDTENASNDDVFAIYNDKDDASNAPIVKFHLEGDKSWINSGDLGLRTNNPNADLHLVHGPVSESDGFKIQQQGTNQFWRFHTSGGGQLFLMNTSSPNVPIGSFSPVNGAYTALSDERAKSNIRNLGSVLPALRMVEPMKYSFKHWSGDEESIGFIAQDVIKYFPEVVTYHAEMDHYTMDYSAFGVLAIQAIKEMDERVTKLEKMVAELGKE